MCDLTEAKRLDMSTLELRLEILFLTDAMKLQDTCTPMFLGAMSTIAKLWKEPRCPSKDDRKKKMWFMYTMEYSSAIRSDKYPPFASTWMELEGIMLSEMSQSEKDKHYMVSFIWRI